MGGSRIMATKIYGNRIAFRTITEEHLTEPLLKKLIMNYQSGNSGDGGTGDSPSRNIKRGDLTSSENQTVFQIPESYIQNSNQLLVFVDGVLQRRNIDYTETSSTEITFLSPLYEEAYVTYIIL
jgi:hypothetical protein